MEPIIEPVSRSLLLAELTPERKVRNTNKASNEIYIFDAAECPSLLREIGRLREVAFRSAGGGTGLAVDIDEEDLAGDGYYQLIVWDPAEQEIVGGYRFIVCTSENPRHLSTEHYFTFSDKFRKEYLPYTIELGRSFVQPSYRFGGACGAESQGEIPFRQGDDVRFVQGYGTQCPDLVPAPLFSRSRSSGGG